jgi:transposase InsO family protein
LTGLPDGSHRSLSLTTPLRSLEAHHGLQLITHKPVLRRRFTHSTGVSNDNAYSESLARTPKYRPQMPVEPFYDLLHARRWVTDLVRWYNYEHQHRNIRFVTPTQRHTGLVI